MSTCAKRRLITKTYSEKYEIIKYCEANPGEKKSLTAKKLKISRTTLNDILKNKSKVIEVIEKGEHPDSKKANMKRIKHVTFEDVDSKLIKWFRQIAPGPESCIDDEMLLYQARVFAGILGHTDRERLDRSWIDRFQKRWSITKVLKGSDSNRHSPEIGTTGHI